ncbi:hypothetical protein [Bifidobacterium choerinum]|uniref:hypothetical protein n=1 Tax=Bifidobacterium choerinum TaxID=35760 RepID=UPI003F9151FE
MNIISPFVVNDQIRRCEHCGRTDQRPGRCPHAIDKRYDCPNDPRAERQLHDRLRRLGR